MGSTPLIDWEQLDMIADGFTPDFVEIYVEYLAEIPQLLSDLGQKIAANDAVNAAKLAHQVKGSSANFGFVGVSDPVAQIEIDAKGGSLASAAFLLSQAQSGFQQAVAEVKTKRGV
jgi:HPt (histidine-containing phosphotransfer) domain-containing protein